MTKPTPERSAVTDAAQATLQQAGYRVLDLDWDLECQCAPVIRHRYLGRLSGPLADRVTVKAQMTIPSERDR